MKSGLDAGDRAVDEARAAVDVSGRDAGEPLCYVLHRSARDVAERHGARVVLDLADSVASPDGAARVIRGRLWPVPRERLDAAERRTMETGERMAGRDAVRDFIIALHSQLFDASPELVNVTVADGVAGLEAVFVGTHIAEFADVPATGLALRLPYCVFYDGPWRAGREG